MSNEHFQFTNFSECLGRFSAEYLKDNFLEFMKHCLSFFKINLA